MDTLLNDLLTNLKDRIVNYLPNLAAGIILLLLGWFLGWFAKRVVVRLCVLLRLERLIGRFRWGEDFSKADVRYGLYNVIGNIAFLSVFLVFTNVALSAMNLDVLSDLLGEVVVFLPRLGVGLLILGLGLVISGWVYRSLRKELLREDFPRAGLIARMGKLVVLLFFSAMALTELGIAREIVVIGFASTILTVGALIVIVAARGGGALLEKLLTDPDDK